MHQKTFFQKISIKQDIVCFVLLFPNRSQIS